MRVTSLSLIALAVSAGYVQSIEAESFLSHQAYPAGVVEESRLDSHYAITSIDTEKLQYRREAAGLSAPIPLGLTVVRMRFA